MGKNGPPEMSQLINRGMRVLLAKGADSDWYAPMEVDYVQMEVDRVSRRYLLKGGQIWRKSARVESS